MAAIGRYLQKLESEGRKNGSELGIDTDAILLRRAETTFWPYPNGSVSDVQYPDGISIHRDYISRGQLKAVTDNLSSQPVIAYTYLQDGKVDHADYRNGVHCAYGYDGRGMTSSIQYTRGDGANLSKRTYWRDERDRITAYQKSAANSVNPMENGRGDRFRYDEEGQLVEAWYNATNPANSGAGNTRYDQFNYDALGNRKGSNYVANHGWMTFTRKDNGLNQYHAWGANPANYDDEIPGWGAPGLANGVLNVDGNVAAGYNALNQAIMINTFAMGSEWLFLGYDPLGRCVKRWTGIPDFSAAFPWVAPESNPATYFYYEGWNLIQEGPSAANASRNYVHGARVDEIVKQITPGNMWERYFHYDARGHCTLQTDTSGNIVEQYEYDAFGQPYFFSSTGQPLNSSTFGNRFLFTGREWLSEVKLYDYRNRMYQPELGRFMQPDPKEFGAGDYNLYRYCHNDPVNKSDPTGEFVPVVVIRAILVNAAIGAAFDVAGQLIEHKGDVSKINKTEVAIAAAVGGAGVGVALAAERAVLLAVVKGPAATLLRTAVNSLGNGAVNATGKTMQNAIEGRPITQNVDKAGVMGMAFGAAGSLATEGATRVDPGIANLTPSLNAAAIFGSAVSSGEPVIVQPEQSDGQR